MSGILDRIYGQLFYELSQLNIIDAHEHLPLKEKD